MLDMKFVRNNPEVVKENIRRKFQDQKLPLVDEVIEFDRKYRAAKTRCDELRNQRNVISKQIGGMMAQGRKEEAEAAKAQVKAMADEMARLEEDEKVFAEEVKKRMMVIPNIIDPSVPIGKDDSENVELERFGDPVVPDFPVPYHVDIMESLDGIDLDAARRTSGNGFYYLKGDVARLHSAILSYARDFMIGRGFTYYIPPFMIRGEVVSGVMSFAEMENMMYKIEGEDLYLIGTSEHSMIGKYIDTINDEASLPQTLTSYSPCFRKEVGAHGIEERGVYRIHQRHRGLVPPSAEVLRGLLLLQPGGRPGPAAGHPGAEGGEQGDLLCPHPQQHGGGAAPDAHRLPGEQSPGGWQCCGAGGPAALYGGTGGASAG